MSPEPLRSSEDHQRRMNSMHCGVATTVFALFAVFATFAAEARTRFDDGPMEIAADRLEYLAHLKVYTAEGRVEVVQGERTLTADWMGFNSQTRRGIASGRVEMRESDDVFRARFVDFDLAFIAIEEPGWVISPRLECVGGVIECMASEAAFPAAVQMKIGIEVKPRLNTRQAAVITLAGTLHVVGIVVG